ncbi:MAG: hypothetical protein FWG71_08070 [Synergistaceae bacterium]|nr:hypothetical protein [Synergistaceae bacterium]
MASGKRNRLLRSIVCIILIATAAVCFPPRPAEAGIITEAAAIVIIATAEVVLDRLMPTLTKTTGLGLAATANAFLYEFMLFIEQELRFDLVKQLYDLDHKPLEKNAVGGDLGAFLSDYVYGRAMLYPGSPDPFYHNYGNDGYKGRAGTGYGSVWIAYDFSQAYRTRMSLLSEQGKAKLRANRELALSVPDGSNPAGIGAVRSVHEALMNSGEYVQRGYRELMQAESQTHTMSNRQASMMRATETVRTDALVRYAINERQEKYDRVAAFDILVDRSWRQPDTSPAY